jgi:GT2 family glycosyltransferase
MPEEMMSWDKRVLISIPTAGDIRAEAVGWVVRTVRDAHEHGYHAGLDITIATHPIDFIRNNQISGFLGTNFNYIFLLDSDCVPMDGTVEKLLAYDLDIVGSIAPGMVEGRVVYTAATREREVGERKFRMLTPDNEDLPKGLQEIDGIGATGILIKREVFEKIPYPWYKVVVTPDNIIDMGEDFFFCAKAIEYGYKIFADFDLRQKHYKIVPLS